MKWLLYFCGVVLLLDSCIDPFPLAININENTLVVEGMITDQPGPYTVHVSYANKVSDPVGQIHVLNSAKVQIVDESGPTETLSQTAPGVYMTAATGIRGTVGHTYSLRITTFDGIVIESNPEQMKPVGDIRNLYYEFEERVAGYRDTNENGFRVYIDSEVLPEQEGMVRWRTEGTWELKTYPELRLKYESGAGSVIVAIPDPPKCSGFVWQIPKPPPGSGRAQVLVKLGECQCCNCWVSQYDDEPIVSDPKFDSEDVTKKFLAFIPATRRLFYNKYHLKVEQMSVSNAVHSFWKSVQQQRRSGSDLFQTPNARTTGNVKSSDKSLNVVGYFGASAVKTQSFFLDRTLVPYSIPAMDTISESCLAAYRNTTTIKPPFW